MNRMRKNRKQKGYCQERIYVNRVREKYKRRKKLMLYMGILFLTAICGFWIGVKIAPKEMTHAYAGTALWPQESYQKFDGSYGQEESVVDMHKSTEPPLLVNRDNPLPEDYSVELRLLPDGVNRAAVEAYEALCDMLTAGEKEGLDFVICSSYRDAEYQKELFDEDVEALMGSGFSYLEAYEKVSKETMPPGCSEHSTGLAFDIVSLHYQMLDASQEHTYENRWLREHCAEYGFILRYPKEKEEITGISYESWHFRYVGVENAKYIMDEGITLEEYINLQTK